VSDAAAAPPAETYETLARAADLHLLTPELTDTELAEGCRISREYGVRALVVRGCDVDQAVRWLGGSSVVLSGAVGYPDGTSTTGAKLYEGRDLLRRGARELEWIMNPARMLSRQFQDVETELEQIARSCEEAGAGLTVVLRNELFPDDVKIIGAKIAKRVGASRISIVFSAPDLQLIRPLLKERVQLKAGRGIDTLERVMEARSGGCTGFGSAVMAAILDARRTQLQAEESAPQPVS
jgi:deoxyribose-phosphate aldolase